MADTELKAAANPASRALVGIQYLRGLAALFVAYFHSLGQIQGLTPYLKSYLLGAWNFATGVDIFFVISGFIMLVTGSKLAPGEFLLRRIIRIVPLYWIFTLLVTGLFLWRPTLIRTTMLNGVYLLKSLFFIPYYNPRLSGEVTPILVPGWSLNFEMFFYLLFTLLLFFQARRRIYLSGAIFLALCLIHYLAPTGSLGPVALFLTDARLLEFWFGMVIGDWYLRGALGMPRAAAVALTLGAMLVLLLGPYGGPDSLWGNLLGTIVPAALIVLGTVSWEQNHGIGALQFMRLLGDASYSMYLSHILVLGLVRTAWPYLGLGDHSVTAAIVYAVLAMTAVIAAAVVVYWTVEKPLTSVLHRYQTRRSGAPQPTSGRNPTRWPPSISRR